MADEVLWTDGTGGVLRIPWPRPRRDLVRATPAGTAPFDPYASPPLAAGGAVTPGLRAPYGEVRAPGPTGPRDLLFEATGFRREWGTPPALEGFVWDPARWVYEPRSVAGVPAEGYRYYRSLAQAGRYLQAYRVSADTSLQPWRQWALRLVRVPEGGPSPAAPYEVVSTDTATIFYAPPTTTRPDPELVGRSAEEVQAILQERVQRQLRGTEYPARPGKYRASEDLTAAVYSPEQQRAFASTRGYSLSDYAWVAQRDLPVGCPYPYAYLPVPQEDYKSGRWLEPDYEPSIPLPYPFSETPWQCAIPDFPWEGKERGGTGTLADPIDDAGAQAQASDVVKAKKRRWGKHGIRIDCDLPGEPPEACDTRKREFLKALEEDLHGPDGKENADLAFDILDLPGNDADLLVLKYTAPPERANDLVDPAEPELATRLGLRELAKCIYSAPEAWGVQGQPSLQTSPKVVLVNNEFGLTAYPAIRHDPAGREDVGVSPAQRGATGSIMFNMEAINTYRDEFKKLNQRVGGMLRDPLGLVAGLFHELTEHIHGNLYRVINNIQWNDAGMNPNFDPGQPPGPDNPRTMRDVVFYYADKRARDAEVELRREMGWPQTWGGGWQDRNPGDRDQPNRLRVSFRAQQEPGAPPPQAWTLTIHHSRQGGLVDQDSYPHYYSFEPTLWATEGALRLNRGG